MSTVRVDPVVLTRAERLEWEHFAAFGWPDERIAARLGLTPETLRRRHKRHQETTC